MSIELVVTIKDEEGKKLSRPFLIYEPFMMEPKDKTIQSCVKELLEEFKGEPEDIKLRVVMVLK